MGFGEILQWLQDNHMGDMAIEVARTGVEDMNTLRNMSIDTMKEHGVSMTNISRLWEGIHGHEIIEDFDHTPITSRPDLPVIHPGGRGSIKRALDMTVTDRENTLIARLEDDMYAQSSKKPREALWKTWCSMAAAWDLQPVPLTEELVIKVGASFKAGHYKSPQNYFSRALQEHRQMTKQHPTPFVQALIKNVIRSITRGAGPTAFKDSFEVELLNRSYDVNSLCREPTYWSEDPSHSRDATLICCWWLLRGIEAAAASTKHVWHQQTRDELTTFITLPVQKTDPTGACVSRGHSCLCKTAPHLKALCPHHAVLRHLATLRKWFPTQMDLPVGMPLIPSPDGTTISQTQIVQLFRDTIQRTGTTMDRPGPTGEPLPRFSQHSCRVSGAQFLTRLGYTVEAVQLIGRWGSDAIRRYIQEAPLQLQHITNPRTPQSSEINTQRLRSMVQKEVQALQHQFWVVNPMTKVCHVPAVPETCIDNSRWVTLCGWNYGTSLYRKQLIKPTTNYRTHFQSPWLHVHTPQSEVHIMSVTLIPHIRRLTAIIPLVHSVRMGMDPNEARYRRMQLDSTCTSGI